MLENQWCYLIQRFSILNQLHEDLQDVEQKTRGLCIVIRDSCIIIQPFRENGKANGEAKSSKKRERERERVKVKERRQQGRRNFLEGSEGEQVKDGFSAHSKSFGIFRFDFTR